MVTSMARGTGMFRPPASLAVASPLPLNPAKNRKRLINRHESRVGFDEFYAIVEERKWGEWPESYYIVS
jgi:hypothetical protein